MQAHGKPKNHDIVQASGDATFRVAKMLSLVGSQGENEERLICQHLVRTASSCANSALVARVLVVMGFMVAAPQHAPAQWFG